MRTAATLLLVTAIALPGCTTKGSDPMGLAPDSQQVVQNTVIAHLRGTLAALAPGAILDAGRFAGAGHNSPCDDSGAGAPMRFHTIGELRTPDGADGTETVAAVGDTWRSWGWQVIERDGFGTSNRFGYAPDGYRLQIVLTSPGRPPTVQASSPCFAREIARDDIPFPVILTVG